MSEPAAAEAPATVWEGTVRPADVTDDGWEELQSVLASPTAAEMANSNAKELAETGNASKNENEVAVVIADLVEDSLGWGGTPEEWTQVFETVTQNFQLITCSMAN